MKTTTFVIQSILFLLLALLLFPSALALEKTLITTNSPAKTFEPCEQQVFTFDIQNTALMSETYFFNPRKSTAQVIPNAITMQAGAKTTITLINKPACSTYGDGKLTIDIIKQSTKERSSIFFKTQTNRSFGFTIKAGSLNQENTTFSKQKTPYLLCKDEAYNIPLQVTNEGTVKNTYTLTLLAQNAQLEKTTLTIEPKKQEQASIHYSPTILGERTLQIQIESALGNFQKKIELPVIVENCYDLLIEASSTKKVETQEQEAYLTNKGTKNITAQLALTGSKYFTLSKTTLMLKPQEKKTLILKAKNKEHPSVEKVVLHARLQNGDIKQKVLRFIYGKPFWFTYGRMVLIGIIFLIALIIPTRRFIKARRPKINESKYLKKLRRRMDTQKTPEKEPKKPNNKQEPKPKQEPKTTQPLKKKATSKRP